MILFALITVFDVIVSVLLVAASGRVNDVLDAIQHRVLGQGRGVVLSNGLLRAFGLLGLLLSSIFVAGLVGLLLAR
jgi:predicted RND superfamily exporter protein